MEQRAFFQKLFQTTAAILPLNEAVAFEMPDLNRPELKVVLHIRPGGGTQEQITGALKAFGQVIFSCVKQKKDAALPIKQNSQPTGQIAQFCIAHMIYVKSGGAYGVAIVSPCKNANESKLKAAVLARLCSIWQDLLPATTPMPASFRQAPSRQIKPAPETSPQVMAESETVIDPALLSGDPPETSVMTESPPESTDKSADS